MKKIFISAIIVLATVYLLACAFLFVKQRDFLYYPTSQSAQHLNKEVFTNNNIKIKTTIVNKGNKDAIIYFGGNAENVDNNIKVFAKIFPKHTIYLVKYRGYGGSMGKPTEKNLYSDALYIYDKIKSRYNNISLIGRSLGSGVATYLASKRDIDKLILVTPYDSIESIAQEIFPFFPISLILKDKYKSIERIKSIKSKVLIIAAQNDQTIKMKHTKKLVDKFPDSQVDFKIIKNASHNSISNDQDYYEALKRFIGQ